MNIETVKNAIVVNRNVLLKVKPYPKEELSKGGLIVPTLEKTELQMHTATIVALASDCTTDLQVGDTIRISRYGGSDIIFEGDSNEYRCCLETEIKMVFRKREPIPYELQSE